MAIRQCAVTLARSLQRAASRSSHWSLLGSSVAAKYGGTSWEREVRAAAAKELEHDDPPRCQHRAPPHLPLPRGAPVLCLPTSADMLGWQIG
ncbi:hypothetical protein E2562_034611 [Oryza meyeriana var. granulata]|uniref:Uncharacterized protein n=1 Tax=Oryza meyeriana var. granulata TaxID=110450 RepID=A0A6G1DRX8_9ORYZ|nr:hypothetical protein E2562_034611 [Oryza meyeriana var. granulata]